MSEDWTEWRKVSDTYSARARAAHFAGEASGADVELRDAIFAKAEVCLAGHIRRDGCANLQSQCLHVCGSFGIDDLAKALRGMYKLAAEVADIDGEP